MIRKRQIIEKMCGIAQSVHIGLKQIYANCSYLPYNTTRYKEFVYRLFLQQCKLLSIVGREAAVRLCWDVVPQRQPVTGAIEANQILNDVHCGMSGVR
jgi:hypothetical protein